MKVKVSPFEADIDIYAPPSKSHAHRLMIAAALSEGKTEIKRVGGSNDVLATARCLKSLGATVEFFGEDVEITGVFSKGNTIAEKAEMHCGESGSTLRFFFPIAAALGVRAEFFGEGNLLKRPNEVLTQVLKKHGVTVDGFKIEGRLNSGDFEVDASVSSQYITGLLFSLPLLKGDSRIILKEKIVSSNYIDITLSVLEKSGIRFEREGNVIKVYGNQKFSLPNVVECEGDWSGAAFIFTLGALTGRATVRGLNPKSLHGDRKIIEILASAGAEIFANEEEISVKKGKLKAFEAYLENCPDLAPTVCALAACCEGESKIYGLGRLKIKESDRLQAIKDFLCVSGIKFFAGEDSLKIIGGEISGGSYDGYKDHRIVMAAVVLAAAAKGDSTVTCGEAVNKSYPRFFEDLGEKANVEMEG